MFPGVIKSSRKGTEGGNGPVCSAMCFLAHLVAPGAAPVPLLGPAFDMDGAHYVTVSIVGEQKNMLRCVGAFKQPFSHLSQAKRRQTP